MCDFLILYAMLAIQGVRLNKNLTFIFEHESNIHKIIKL